MGVCSNFKERPSIFEDMLRQVINVNRSCDGVDDPVLSKVYEVCDAMVDGLVDPSQFLNFVSYSSERIFSTRLPFL